MGSKWKAPGEDWRRVAGASEGEAPQQGSPARQVLLQRRQYQQLRPELLPWWQANAWSSQFGGSRSPRADPWFSPGCIRPTPCGRPTVGLAGRKLLDEMAGPVQSACSG